MRRVLLTGCSGGGKSTLLSGLARRGVAAVEEPGRRVLREGILPWENAQGFAARAFAIAVGDFDRADADLTVFDRGILDALLWYRRTGTPLPDGFAEMAERRPYDPLVLLAPPWPELYGGDPGRKLPLEEALAEYDAIEAALPEMGYEPLTLPMTSVSARADFVVEDLTEVAA